MSWKCTDGNEACKKILENSGLPVKFFNGISSVLPIENEDSIIVNININEKLSKNPSFAKRLFIGQLLGNSVYLSPDGGFNPEKNNWKSIKDKIVKTYSKVIDEKINKLFVSEVLVKIIITFTLVIISLLGEHYNGKNLISYENISIIQLCNFIFNIMLASILAENIVQIIINATISKNNDIVYARNKLLYKVFYSIALIFTPILLVADIYQNFITNNAPYLSNFMESPFLPLLFFLFIVLHHYIKLEININKFSSVLER